MRYNYHFTIDQETFNLLTKLAKQVFQTTPERLLLQGLEKILVENISLLDDSLETISPNAESLLESYVKNQYSKLPSLDNFANNCVGVIHWPNNSCFELKSAQLRGAFILGGDLT